MCCTIIDGHCCAEYAMADQGTFLTSTIESFLASKYEFLGDGTSDDLFGEFVSVKVAKWFHPSCDASEFARTTCLLLEEMVKVHFFSDGLSVSNLWLTSLTFDAVFASHTFNVYFKM